MKYANHVEYKIREELSRADLCTSRTGIAALMEQSWERLGVVLTLAIVEKSPNLDHEDETLP